MNITLAKIFMCNFERNLLDKCPAAFMPLYYRRYVDDIFVLFSSSDHVEKFKEYFSSKHRNINFSYEKENENNMSFLDILISRENEKFVTNVYRKPTFSGVYTNFESFIPQTYKIGLVFSLLHRIFHLSSDFKKFHHEVNNLKNILYKNSYPVSFVDDCIKKFLNKIFAPKKIVFTVPKKEIMIVLPYLGKISLNIRTKIIRMVRSRIPYCNVRFVYQSKCKLSNLFTFKDRIPKFLRSGIVYKFQCGGCNATYYGKTQRHFKVRIGEHLGVSPLTGKKVKGVLESSIKDHLLFCKFNPNFEDFSIIANNDNNFKITLMESLLISRDHPTLNKNIKSMPLELFNN